MHISVVMLNYSSLDLTTKSASSLWKGSSQPVKMAALLLVWVALNSFNE